MRSAVREKHQTEVNASFLNPLDASLRVCIEMDKAMKYGIDPAKLSDIRRFIDAIIQESATVNYELTRLILPIDLIQQSSQSDLSCLILNQSSQAYPHQIQQLKTCFSVVNGDLGEATIEQLQCIRDACWQIHELLAIARHTRLAGE